MLNPVALGIAAVVATIGIAALAIDHFTESFDEAVEKAEKSRSAYEQTASEVKSLESQLSDVKDRISELNFYGFSYYNRRGRTSKITG